MRSINDKRRHGESLISREADETVTSQSHALLRFPPSNLSHKLTVCCKARRHSEVSKMFNLEPADKS